MRGTQRLLDVSRQRARPASAGWAGVAVACLAVWVAVPPVAVRSPVVPILLGVLAVVLGAVALSRGSARPGTIAILAGILGAVLGWAATRSSLDNLESVVVWSSLLPATLRWATPLIFAAIGGLFSERSGVANIGLEGMMLTGALFAILGAEKTGSWQVGLVVGVVAGGALALLLAVFSIHLRADQIVCGTAVNFIALGITGFVLIDVYGQTGVPSDVPAIPSIDVGGLEAVLGWMAEVPLVGSLFGLLGAVLGDLNLMIWIALAAIAVSWFVLWKMPVGLRIRAVGEHPGAADAVGISVYGVRYGSVVASGMLAAAGGAYLSIGFVGSFNENMTAGRGFIALAALIFGNWRPFGAAAACLLFGFSSALAQRLPVYSESAGVPVDVLFQALPYVLTLIAVAGVIGRSIPPAAVGRPYKKQ
jgi:simple sugar transport system permease protein